MNAAMEVLYNYAQEYLLCALLPQEREYAETRLCAEKQEERFRALLDDAAGERLEALLEERDQLAFYHSRALFHAGFRLAAELLRE